MGLFKVEFAGRFQSNPIRAAPCLQFISPFQFYYAQEISVGPAAGALKRLARTIDFRANFSSSKMQV